MLRPHLGEAGLRSRPVGASLNSSGGTVTRWMQYDTLGRMVLNAEPDTSVGFTPTVGNTAGLLAWRYAYNDNGEVVGTSDARGCGVNYFRDAGGRFLAEDFSPCLASQPAYTAPNLTTGDGTEAFYWYDSLDTQLASDPVVDSSSGVASTDAGGCLIQADLLKGRVVAISDRGSRTVMGYDGRGRAQCMAKQMASPGTASSTLASRYAPRVYAQTVTFDAADRPVTASTGAQAVLDSSSNSSVTTSYSRRGVVKQVTSGYGDLVASIARAADGPVGTITYGDLAGTSSAFTYDARRRLSSVLTMRGPPTSWPTGGSPTVYQHVLENSAFTYDFADNPTQITDARNPAEWPAGSLPVSRSIAYDDLYRATAITYASPAGYGPDTWVDPFLAEDTGTTTDPRLAQPSPHVSFTNRVQSQTVAYDWLGNTTQTGDDVGGFYDRSLGTITNGGTGAGPYQLTAAAGGTSPRQGSIATVYDGAGNLTGMTVSRPSAPCVPSGATCSQRYAYDWDEVGRLARARRWDGASLGAPTTALPPGTPAVDLSYTYDASDSRTLKTAVDSSGNQSNTVYIYDDFELRRAGWNGTDYDDTVDTEVPYLFSHGVRLARVEYSTTDPSPNPHVILELQDHLGSASIAIDQATSEVVERGTYMGYGGADSDYRPAAWGGFREDYRFTGKEEDVEVGLDYFGKRFYSPALGRWVSADPLAVHSPGQADQNLYAYVHGHVLVAVDPTGLDGKEYAEGASVGFAQWAWSNAKAAVSDSVVGQTVQAGVALYKGDYKEAAVHAAYAAAGTVPGVQSVLAEVGVGQSLAALPDQISAAVNAPNDYEAGRLSAAPSMTIGMTVGAVADMAGGGGKPAKSEPSAPKAGSGEAGEGVPSCSGRGCPSSCFVAGTVVQLAAGPMPIEQVTLGARVRTVGDERCASIEHGDALYKIRLDLERDDGSGSRLDIELLREASWIRDERAAVGGAVALRVDEIGVAGRALVLEIVPHAGIPPGPGCIVTGTLAHDDAPVLAVRLDGVAEPLQLTAGHRLYSEDRGSWVRAGLLRIGERLAADRGTSQVTSVDAVPTRARVYNLEIERAHTFEVTERRVVVHNAGTCGAGAPPAGKPQPTPPARFVSQPDGVLIDTQATPRGSYDQPNGGRTDILQAEDHGAGLSHTHERTVNVDPATGTPYPGKKIERPLSAADVDNIQSGAATRSKPKNR